MTFLRSLPTLRRLASALGTLAAVATAWLPSLASADPVTYSFAGIVSDDDAGRGFQAFSGSFTFDSNASDSIGNGSTAAYAHAGNPWGISVSFDGGSVYSYSSLFNVLVTNDLIMLDQFGVLGQEGSDGLGLTLTDYTQSVFSSVALPTTGLDLASFWSSELTWEADGMRLTGSLTSLSCTSGCAIDVGGPGGTVPEPGSLPLVSFGLLVLVSNLRRRMGAR